MLTYDVLLIGSASSLVGLNTYQPQEYCLPDGSLMLLELRFAETPTQAMVDSINSECTHVNVTPWPGYPQVASLDPTNNTILMRWTKGLAWLAIIGVILALIVLPALLGSFLWLIIPKEIKNLFSTVAMVGVMMLMFSVMKPLLGGGKERRKRIAGGEK